MSGTDYTLTPNLGLYKPTVDADGDQWGGHWNLNADKLDTVLGSTAGGPFLPLSGGTVSPGMLTANGGLTVSGASSFYVANPAATGLTFNQNVFGTAGAGQAAWQAFNISADTANATAAQGHGATAAAFGHTISAGAVGGRTTMLNNLVQTGATTMTTSDYYVAHGAFATVNASTGGTAGVPVGALFGRNASARIAAGAGLYQLGVCGDEINVSVQAGTAVLWKAGLNIVQWADDAVQGSQTDWAFGIVNQASGTAPGWKTGISFGGVTGWWAFRNTSTMIGTSPVAAGGPAVAANWGIDFSAVAFTGGLLRSVGFTVNGAGHIHTDAGIDFDNHLSTGAQDFSKHIDLYNGQFGINIDNTSATNYNSPAAHTFWIGTTEIGYWNTSGLNFVAIGQQSPNLGTFSQVQVGSTSGPTWTTGSAAPASTQPVGSLYSRVGGAVGATLYVSRGAGAWAAVAGV